MIRRWFGVVLVLWGAFASLLVFAPAADAAINGYSFSSTTAISTNGAAVFNGSGTTFVYKLGCGLANITYTINVGAAIAAGGYNGTITTQITGKCVGADIESGAITIADPNSLGPNGGSPPGGPNGSGATSATAATPVTCDAGSLTWAICPGITFLVDVIDNVREDILVPFLHEQPLSTTTPGTNGQAAQPNPVYQIWAAFRDVASVFFILVFFLIIFGTAIGLDNYTVKKIMPHLIAGAILMPFSWYICAVMVDIGNVLGQGLFALANTFIPAPQIDFTSSLSQLLLGGVGIGGGLAAISLGVSSVAEIGLGVLFTILFAILAALFTLVLRKILIILLVILSPFALLAWILPNTQRLFRLWMTNMIRLVLMYPLIMMLFEAGRIFALTAGTLITSGGSLPSVSNLLVISVVNHNPFAALVPLTSTLGVGHALAADNDFEKAAVPFLQLLGLFLPLAAIPWTFKWAGGAMSAGSSLIQRGRKAADNRFGRGSEWDKSRSEVRKQRALLNSNDESRSRLGRAISRSRAGQGGGFAGLGRGNELQQLQYKQALDSAYKNTGTVDALERTRNGQIPAESHQQRLAAEDAAASNQLVDERAGRAGLAQATDSTGAPPNRAVRYNAVLDAQRRKESELAGQHQSVVEGNALAGGAQSSATVARSALAAGLDERAVMHGKTTGHLTHEVNLDEAAVEAEQQRLGRTLTSTERANVSARARRVRFQTGRQAASGAQVEELGKHAGDQAGRVRDEQEEEGEAVARDAAAAAASGAVYGATQRSETLERVRRDRSTEMVAATAETTRKAAAKSSGERVATLNDAITNPLSREQLTQSSQDVTEGKLGVEAGIVRGNIRGTDQAIQELRRANPTLSYEQARQQVMRTGSDAYANLTRRQILNAYGQNLGTLDSEVANPLGATALVGAARYTQAKAQGREAGGVQATNRAAVAEARRAGVTPGRTQAYQSASTTTADATRIAETKKLSEAAGQEYATINANTVQPVSAETYGQNAERSTERTLGAEAGAVQRELQAAQEAEQRIVNAPLPTGGTPPTQAQARAELIRNAADTKGRQAYIDTQANYVADKAAIQGHDRAVQNVIDDAAAAGVAIAPVGSTPAQIRAVADAQVYEAMRSATERDAYNKSMGEYADARGVVEARAGQQEAAKQELIANGRTLDVVKGEIAAKKGIPIAGVTDDEANRQLTEEAGETVERAAHGTAVKAKRDTIVKSTGDEIGTMQAEEKELTDQTQKIKDDAKKAGKPIPSDADARAQARQGLVTKKVRRSIKEKREGTTEEVAGDEGALSGDDKSINNELADHPDEYAHLATPEEKREAAKNRILDKVRSAAERKVRNEQIGKAAEVEGIAKGRRERLAAVREEIAKREDRTTASVTGAEVEDMVERSSHLNRVKEESEKLINSAAQSIGTRKGVEAGLDDEAKRIQQAVKDAGGVPPSDDVALAQARQNAATNKLRTGINAKELEVAGEIGKERGITKLADAAVDLEQETTLGKDVNFASTPVTVGSDTTMDSDFTIANDTKFPHEVTDTTGTTYKVGETVPKNTKLKAGTKVTTGTKLAAGATLKAGTRVQRGTVLPPNSTIKRDVARKSVARKAVAAGQEQGVRNQATTQGDIAAYARAASEGTPADTQRLATYEQAGLEKIATETAATQAQADLAAEGRAMHQDFRSMVSTRGPIARERIFDDRVSAARHDRPDAFDGVERSKVELSVGKTGNVPVVVKDTVDELRAGRTWNAVANMERLRSDEAFDALVKDVRYRDIDDGGVGGSWFDTFDPSAPPEREIDMIWDKGAGGADFPDATKPIIAGANNVKVDAFNTGGKGLGNATVQRYLDYYNYGEPAVDAVIARQRAVADDDDTDLPESRRKAAERAITRYEESKTREVWKGQSGIFVSSLTDALEKEKTGQVKFDKKVLATIANDAAYALAHPADETLFWNNPQNPRAQELAKSIIVRAEETGIDWYRTGSRTEQPTVPYRPDITRPDMTMTHQEILAAAGYTPPPTP